MLKKSGNFMVFSLLCCFFAQIFALLRDPPTDLLKTPEFPHRLDPPICYNILINEAM